MKKYKKNGHIKTGVVGYGNACDMGKLHLDSMKKAGMTPLAVAEIDPSRLEVAKADFPGIETYDSMAAMLKESDVDLVTIITPHNTHAELAAQALKAGRHVICEKPMAITTRECDSLMAEARKRGLMLTAFHNRHWDGHILAAMKHIRAGLIGDVVRVELHMGNYTAPADTWRGSRTITGGVLYDWGVHLLDYALQIVNSDIVDVSGFFHNGVWADKTRWKKDVLQDEGLAIIRFKSGAWASLLYSNIDANPRRGMIDITGTKGSYVMDWPSNELIQCKGDKTVTTRYKNPPAEWHRFYPNLAAHLVKGDKLIITPEWARRPIHILDLATRSAECGRSLKAKYA